MDRFEAQVGANGMLVFCRIDYAAGAHEVGLELGRASLIVIFARTRLIDWSMHGE